MLVSLHEINTETTPVPEYSPAVLSAVVHISDDDFWMTSCGNWNGPHHFCQRFSDVKLTCTVKADRGHHLARTFPLFLTAMANIPAKFSSKKDRFVEGSPAICRISLAFALIAWSIRFASSSSSSTSRCLVPGHCHINSRHIPQSLHFLSDSTASSSDATTQ